MDILSELKEKIYNQDNTACFIERDRILGEFEKENAENEESDRFAKSFAAVLSGISVPIEDEDVFVGRMVEGAKEKDIKSPNSFIRSDGHKSLDYEMILRLGFGGILKKIYENAEKIADKPSQEFLNNAKIVIKAVLDFAKRYSKAAASKNKPEAAEALVRGIENGAYDLFSALQCMWLVHLIASCVAGDRDFAFGNFDYILYPYYKKSVENGCGREEIINILACFFVKTNEICGRTTHNYKSKPIVCFASKQYVNIGGKAVNEFSYICLEAAKILNMPQPQIVVLLSEKHDNVFKDAVFETLSVITDKMNIYNYDLIKERLMEQKIPEVVAQDVTFSACCTLDLNHHTTTRNEFYIPSVKVFADVLRQKEYKNTDEILCEYKKELKKVLSWYNEHLNDRFLSDDAKRSAFVFDSVCFSDCIEKCSYPRMTTMPYELINYFFTGVATIGDSLAVIDDLVFNKKRFTYNEFIDILNKDFSGYEDVLSEIKKFTKFGNDTEVDEFTVMVANAFCDVLEDIKLPENRYAVGGFYSLERDNTSVRDIPATPDGRLSGTPFSENQSPTYGEDKNGITALLKSVSKLPFNRAVSGGLNLTFSQKMPGKILSELICTYFKMGGLHTGITVLNREELLDAMKNPNKYKSLTVRLYGFSEYFISLPEWQQIAVLKRTEY